MWRRIGYGGGLWLPVMGLLMGVGVLAGAGFLWVWFVEGYHAGMGSISQTLEIHNGQGG